MASCNLLYNVLYNYSYIMTILFECVYFSIIIVERRQKASRELDYLGMIVHTQLLGHDCLVYSSTVLHYCTHRRTSSRHCYWSNAWCDCTTGGTFDSLSVPTTMSTEEDILRENTCTSGY